MDLKWMGRYRELVRELIYHSNSASLNHNYPLTAIEDGITLTKHEYQILEYLLEFDEKNHIQSRIAQDLGIQPSMMTNAAKRLLSMGLIERYRIEGNRKSIVPKITPKGEAAYWAYCTRDALPLFEPFFDMLQSISDEDLQTLIAAFRAYNKRGDDYGSYHLKLMKDSAGRKD